MPGAKKTVSGADLAALLGRTERAVAQWREAGCPYRKEGRGAHFVVAEVVAWLEKRAEERGKKAAERADPGRNGAHRGGSGDEESVSTRKTRAEAELKELQVLERRGRLVDADEAQARYDAFVGGVAAVVTGQLTRFERDMVQATDAPAARRLTYEIQSAILGGLRDHANVLDDEAAALDAAADAAA